MRATEAKADLGENDLKNLLSLPSREATWTQRNYTLLIKLAINSIILKVPFRR